MPFSQFTISNFASTMIITQGENNPELMTNLTDSKEEHYVLYERKLCCIFKAQKT